MKKSFIILGILIVVVALVVSCNPDQLSKTGQFLSNLSDAGLVSRNTKFVNDAAVNVKSFIEESEKAFDWPGSLEPGPDYDVEVPFKIGDAGEKFFVDTVDKTVEMLLAARDSSAKDAVLREALSAKYNGKTSREEDHILTTKNLYNGIKRERHIQVILHVVETALSTPERSNMAFVLNMLGLKGITVDTVEEGINKAKEIELPFPLQSYDYALLVGKLFDQVKAIQEAVQTSSSASGDRKNVNLDALKRFQKDIATSTSERNYQTVGDKIAVGITFSILKKVIEINNAYVANPNYYGKCEEGHKYDLFFDFLLTEPEGKGKLDGLLSGLDAISYIYGVKLDMAGLISGAI